MSIAVEGFDDDTVDRALVVYVGRGETDRPERRPDAVRALVAPDRAPELVALVERINEVADSIELSKDDAENFSLVPAFTRRIRTTYPWIDDRASEALCWASRYRRLFE